MIPNETQSNKCIESVVDCTQQLNNQTNSDQNNKDEEFIDEDDYYRVGDYVDALDSDTGAWFEARVTKISSINSNEENKYYVIFERESIGSNIALGLQQIRPQSSTKIAFDDLREGQVVLANFNSDSNKERGYWYECRIDKKLNTNKTLYVSVYMADIALKRQKIRFIDEIYKIETNIKRSERSIDDEVLIQFGAKTKREFPFL